MPYGGSLGLYMAGCGTENTTDANIEGRIALGGFLVYPGRVKGHGAVTEPLLHRRLVT